MQVNETLDELRFFELDEISKRANGRSRREIHRDLKKEGCPLVLKWVGKKKACDVATLRAYLAWLWNQAQV